MHVPERGELHRAISAYDSVATAYEVGRPSYPAEAVAWLIAEGIIGPGRVVLDLAAGTGKLTRLLLESGARVIAVEPVASFRQALAPLSVEIREGTAERIPLAADAVDAVTVAAAFHWFDAPRALEEIARVLRPGGALAVLWNERDPHDETQRALTALLEPHRRDEPRQADEAWLKAFACDRRFMTVRKRDFVHRHTFTADTLVERVRSISFVAALADEPHARLLEQVRELARTHLRERAAVPGETFELPHVTHVYLTALASGDQRP